jgi:hypothetical protein
MNPDPSPYLMSNYKLHCFKLLFSTVLDTFSE